MRDLIIATQRKPKERNQITINSSPEQCDKNKFQKS